MGTRSAGIAAALSGAVVIGFALGASVRHEARADNAASPDGTCASTSPCLTVTNTSSGPAIKASSSKGTAITASGGPVGLTATGKATAVIAKNFNGTGNGYLFEGVGPTGTAFSVDEYGDEVARAITVNGPSFSSDGLYASTTGGGAAGSFGVEGYGLSGVEGVATGNSGYYTGILSVSTVPAEWLYQGYSSYHNGVTFEVADDGTVFAKAYGTLIAGKIAQKTSTGRTIDTYSPQASEPVLEDNGEAQLVDGVATVALDRTFATAIERSTPYLVTLTPEGDCRGLYVAQRNASSFTVHELQGGHSSIGFSYRIVAKPYDSSAPRLPASELPKILGAPIPKWMRSPGRP